MDPTYPGVAERLLTHCRRYRHGSEELESLKAEIWSAASQVSIPEEHELREFLQQAEGRLDMIQFTVDESELKDAVLAISKTIEARLVSYLADSDGRGTQTRDLQ